VIWAKQDSRWRKIHFSRNIRYRKESNNLKDRYNVQLCRIWCSMLLCAGGIAMKLTCMIVALTLEEISNAHWPTQNATCNLIYSTSLHRNYSKFLRTMFACYTKSGCATLSTIRYVVYQVNCCFSLYQNVDIYISGDEILEIVDNCERQH